MASSLQGAQLTEAHRQMQIALRALFLQDLIALWQVFDIKDIDRTYDAIERALFAVVLQRREQSYAISQRYAELFRIAERATGAAPPPKLMTAEWEAPAAISLRVTGPIAAKQLLARAVPPQQAAQTTLVRVSGAGSRLVLDGGREALTSFVQADGRALGWARVTDGDPCYFCAMLASRGPVYKSEGSADFEAHDHDACTAEPIYHKSSRWPSDAKKLQRTWDEVTRGTKGEKEAQAAWRDYWEKQRKPR